MLGPNTLITAASYDYRRGSPMGRQPMLEADVKIGKDVWIGAGAVVLMGSCVGDGAIVGANAVVRGKVPAGAIVAGNPAQCVGVRHE
ncbi:hypothetical protein So717_03810 [Roseobacter cerasinus]|uniref:Acetyltransferase n=2 Tax=Roseobacter cerasinus TaxID=2602289 RepID=A0A640VJI5_9RHOB|nr:hypothetical protein So717_03810 [Roseobacter cerasinus]